MNEWGWLFIIVIIAIAVVFRYGGHSEMKPETVKSDKAPEAIGPYSQAILAGKFLFCSGQVGIKPSSGELVSADVSEQIKQVMENLNHVLTQGGSSFKHVVQTTIYLTNLDDFATVNKIYAESFPEAPPARATVQVSRLPKEAKVEISCIAVIP